MNVPFAPSELSGLELMRGIMDGSIPPPPMATLMGFEPIEVDAGRAVFAATPGPEHYSPLGAVHGGFAATLLDTVMGCAVQSGLEAGAGYTTVELSLNYVRPITAETGPVRAEGHVVHLGARLATAEGRLTDEDGRLLAHGTTTIMVLGRSGTGATQEPSGPA